MLLPACLFLSLVRWAKREHLQKQQHKQSRASIRYVCTYVCKCDCLSLQLKCRLPSEWVSVYAFVSCWRRNAFAIYKHIPTSTHICMLAVCLRRYLVQAHLTIHISLIQCKHTHERLSTLETPASKPHMICVLNSPGLQTQSQPQNSFSGKRCKLKPIHQIPTIKNCESKLSFIETFSFYLNSSYHLPVNQWKSKGNCLRILKKTVEKASNKQEISRNSSGEFTAIIWKRMHRS